MKYYLSDELKGRIDTNKNNNLVDDVSSINIQNISIDAGYVFMQYYTQKALLKSKFSIDYFELGNEINNFTSPAEFKLKSIKKDDNKFLVTIFIEEILFWEKLYEKNNDQ
jgi:hypothetical protein